MRRTVVPMLASPGFTGAVALLVLNDHVLKWWVPGAITGKLSDFAGIVVVAVLLRCVVRNDAVAVAATATGFVILKSVGAVALLASPVLGGVTSRDPTDLLAVSVLAPVYVWFRKRREHAVMRVPPIAILQIPAVVVAVMATTATSCAEPARVDRLVTHGDIVWAGITENVYESNGEESEQVRWARSDDGGRHWVGSEAPTSGDQARGDVCESARCWRTIPEERVEVDSGSGWEPAFAFTDEQWRQQELATSSGCDFPRDHTFGSIAVLDGEPGTVLVTMGTQGILRYDGRGSWDRVGVLDRVPAAMPGPTWMLTASRWTLLGLGAASIVLLIVGSFGLVWSRPQRRWFTGSAIAGAGAVALLMMTGGLLFSASRLYLTWSAIAIGLAVGVFLASLITVARPLRPLPPPLPPPPLPPPPRP